MLGDYRYLYLGEFVLLCLGVYNLVGVVVLCCDACNYVVGNCISVG